ncbi:MAG: 2Fe-2S iron-sulfur cluster-binding protein [Thermodesulfobacteriota bacterium]
MSERKQVCLRVLRYNPQVDKDSYYQTYFVPVAEEKMNLLQALEYVYREQDSTLAFRRYSCGLQFCNSCRMLINGKGAHACLTIVEPDTEWEVGPLPGRRVLRDLIVEDHDE